MLMSGICVDGHDNYPLFRNSPLWLKKLICTVQSLLLSRTGASLIRCRSAPGAHLRFFRLLLLHDYDYDYDYDAGDKRSPCPGGRAGAERDLQASYSKIIS